VTLACDLRIATEYATAKCSASNLPLILPPSGTRVSRRHQRQSGPLLNGNGNHSRVSNSTTKGLRFRWQRRVRNTNESLHGNIGRLMIRLSEPRSLTACTSFILTRINTASVYVAPPMNSTKYKTQLRDSVVYCSQACCKLIRAPWLLEISDIDHQAKCTTRYDIKCPGSSPQLSIIIHLYQINNKARK
jgi:hypothetical protein